MIGFPIAVVFSNAFEWYAHKYWLHEYAKTHRQSPFFAHMRHHKRVRLDQFADDTYTSSFLNHEDIYVEKSSLIAVCALTSLAAPVAPFFTLGTYYCAWNYYRKHSRAHKDPEWAKANLPWHYDHHMNADQDANWCVTRPWFDYIMGTRVKSELPTGETNPLGMKLPSVVEKPLNRVARRLLPAAYERLESGGCRPQKVIA